MRFPSRVRYAIPAVLGCLLLPLPALYAAGEQALGLVRSSRAASLGGAPVPGTEVIYDGDLLTTTEGGSALVELKPGAGLRIAGNSSVRFVRDGQMVRAELVSGAVVAESSGEPAMEVATSRYQFAPAPAGKCRYLVRLSKEQATVAAAMNGDVIIKAGKARAGYVLHQGQYAAIPAPAAGVPAQSVAAGGGPEVLHAGIVRDVIANPTVQRQGQGAAISLKVDDAINPGDVVTTGQSGRVRILLADGSLLNVGTGSTLRIGKYVLEPRQAAIELNAGRIRVWAGKVSRPGASWTVQTPTAVAAVAGSDSIVEAGPDGTTVICMDNLASVRSLDQAITGQVVLYAGQFTTVARGLAPTAPQGVANPVLKSQIDQTAVGPPEPGGPGEVVPAAPAGWHIGSLSEAESVGLIVGVGAGAAAGVAIPLALASPTSP